MYTAFPLPPLPQDWTEHLAPTGQPYYYNSVTQESTYIRPILAQSQPSKKKDEPLLKTQIPGTEWLRITTTHGNVFYFHKPEKQSLWLAPDEIKSSLDALLAQEALRGQRTNARSQYSKTIGKRKAEGTVPIDEMVVNKKAKVEDVISEDESESAGGEEEEEEWQREAAQQLAAEAEEEKKRAEERKREEESEAQRSREASEIAIPQRADLSIEEGKVLFKALLREKDINPLHPWDMSLPKFIQDPRYVVLPTVTTRREAFDEYCKERARELRRSAVKKEKEVFNPKDEFERLLKEEVTSTRASWTAFRKSRKKDRRFYGWGRDDREREKRFRGFLKELGEKKREAAQKAEADFFALLKEHVFIAQGASWKEAKNSLYKDPRYEAVGSSSLREELFDVFLKGKNGHGLSENADASSSKNPSPEDVPDRQERRNKAVKEREDRVRTERRRLEVDIEKSKIGINLGEGERLYMTLLTDAIRDPQSTWDNAISQLETDRRFTDSSLPISQRKHLFQTHVSGLRTKQLDNLRGLFEAHAPSLATGISALPLATIMSSVPVVKLAFDAERVESEFNKWQRERTSAARAAFDEMMKENSFVEFWGRLRKMGNQGLGSGLQIDDEDIGEESEEKVDMKALAKNVDIKEMEKVLKNDRRYITFDHAPEQRERWLRDYLSNLSAPKFSVHVEGLDMRLARLLVPLTFLASYAAAEDGPPTDLPKAKHSYQSDVARLRKIVINSLYSHQEIFLRELISNANDALEKLRLTALTDKGLWDGTPLNVTIKAVKDGDGKGGRLVITDNGIGMSPEELATNLGTLAKSGTSDFLSKAEGSEDVAQGNLIGAFGLGFYSSFLVADAVEVASIPPKSAKYPNPVQHVFRSSADDSTFEVYPDPRGNTLGRGTEITLFLKPDATEYLDEATLSALVNKHSAFSSAFPIYLFERWTEEVPDESSEAEPIASKATPETSEQDNDEVLVEEVVKEDVAEVESPKRMVNVTREQWSQLNRQLPLWARDPKNITTDEYKLFYTASFKDFIPPLAWHHFSADAGSGVAFKALLFFPSKLTDDFWQKPLEYKSKDFKLMVKRVFITSDLGDEGLPKWASWVKVVVDAEDLPLNVSRENLQSNRFLRQLKSIIIKRMIRLFKSISEGDDQAKIDKMQETYGSVLKLGAVEDSKNREELASLTRFTTNQRNNTSFDQYLENKKKGQKNIFYIAEIGKKPEDLAQSVFIEKLHARGYEVLLLTEPLDEILIGHLQQWKGFPFQDAAKAGLKFGDEDLDPEEEREQQKEHEEKFKPLIEWLKKEAGDAVRDVVLSNRLVKSPCAIVADAGGYTANIQRMMSASNAKGNRGGILHDYAIKAKLLEINPFSPLIEGLLRRVEALPTDEDEKDIDAEDELKEVTSILIDGALVRSGFEVPDSNRFFNRVDRVLRRSLGVSESATVEVPLRPAPPVETDEPQPIAPEDLQGDEKPGIILSDELKDKISIEMEEIDEDGNPVEHDEL
ncbi:Hsp90 protein-domain-containing protein [Gymnopilus junonius]|uniref:Hsp90 protein-domain-containing protein n=1 Tax=Gymnopilus junonius TaxID=109634 RepID=A0A9P5P1B3_GYMJU|nr:Hsp90 protein-domain-containing protein [Gymnopilus junonius]